MITRLMIIQKINENGKIDVFQISSNNFQWSFENRRTKIAIDKDFFPFVIRGNIDVLKRSPGAETKIKISDNNITFIDDYGVPQGTVIAIIFPANFVPDVIKFKDKPFIPIGFAGQVSTNPPGQFELKYHEFERKCAIIFSIHHDICFGFKSLLKKVKDEDFPKEDLWNADDLYDVTLSREFLKVDNITTEDLSLINQTLSDSDIFDLNKTMNELLSEFKAGRKEKSTTLMSKVGSILLNGTSTISSLTTIADSYKHGDIAQQFIAKIIAYTTL